VIETPEHAGDFKQHGQPPSGASDGISAPHCGQTLGALIIGGESLTRSLSFYCVKSYERLCPDHSNSIAKLILATTKRDCAVNVVRVIAPMRFTGSR
jgi:hypothetical protein